MLREFNKKCQKLTIKDFIHKISKITMPITTIFYIKIQELVEETTSSQFKTFTTGKITQNKLTPRKWRKSRKVFTTKIKLFKTTLNMMRPFHGKKQNLCRISKISKRAEILEVPKVKFKSQ